MRFLSFLSRLYFLCCTCVVVSASPTFKIGLVKDDFAPYAVSDADIFNGAMYWSHWINEAGGLKYNNTVREVEIVSMDATAPNASAVNAYVSQAYEKLVTQNGVDLIMSPFNTARTSAAIEVSEKYGLINLVTGAQTDNIFRRTTTKIFTSVTPNAEVAPKVLQLLVGAGAKTFIMFMRPDNLAVNTGSSAIKYLQDNGLTMVKFVWINVSTPTDEALKAAVRNASHEHLPNAQADIFIYSSLSAEFALIVSTVDAIQPRGIKSCVFMNGATHGQQEHDHLGNIGDYWLTYTRFDPSFRFGTLGKYGGTTAQFIADYTRYAAKAPDVHDALAPAILMTWWRAVQLCDCINPANVTQTMKNMSYFETFAFPVKYYDNGTNMYPQITNIQYVDGEGRPATEVNFIYPMVWRSSGERTLKEYDTPLGAGLGAFAGVAILLFIFASYMLYNYTENFRAHGSFYGSLLLFGILLSYMSAIVLIPKPRNTLCVAFPWLLGIAFNLVYGCLFIKTWALYQVWRKAAQCKKSNLTPYYIGKVIGVFMLLEITFLIVWTVIDPPRVVLVETINNTAEYQCDTKTPTFWIVFMSIKGAWLIVGAVLAVLTRHLSKDFNESTNIAYAIYNNIVLIVIAIPLTVLLKDTPGGRKVIEVTIIILAFSFTMCILFFGTWYSILFPKQEALGRSMNSLEAHSAGRTNSNSKSSHDSGGRNSNSGRGQSGAESVGPLGSGLGSNSRNSNSTAIETGPPPGLPEKATVYLA